MPVELLRRLRRLRCAPMLPLFHVFPFPQPPSSLLFTFMPKAKGIVRTQEWSWLEVCMKECYW